MSNYYSYNELSKLNGKINTKDSMIDNFKSLIKKKEIIKNGTGLDESLYNFMNMDVYLNPCRLMWSLHKIKNKLSDNDFGKKLVADPSKTSVKNFLNYSSNLSHRMVKYLDHSNLSDLDKKNKSISIVNNIIKEISDKCTIDTLSEKSNKLANAIITQMITVPSEGSSDNLYKSIIDYSSIGYTEINSSLRGIAKKHRDSIINDIVNIDLVFDKYSVSSVSYDEGIRLYRGMSNVFFTRNGIQMETNMVKELQKGDIISDMGYVSSSLDINTSLGSFFTGEINDDRDMSCCCIFTFIYPPHMPFIPMADFNIENIVSKSEIHKKKTAFGFMETELLLPRNFNFKIIDKVQVDEILNMDSLPAKNFRSITVVICEIVYNISSDTLNKIKSVNNMINLSSVLYKNIINGRNSFLFKNEDTKKKYYDMYKKKVNKFKITKTWFNDSKDPNDTISFVYNDSVKKGGSYEKYIKYKSKYLELKKMIGGDSVNYIKKISFSMDSLLNLFMSISLEQNCCLIDLKNIKTNNESQLNFMKIIQKNFTIFKQEIDKILVFPSFYESFAKRIHTYSIENVIDILQKYIWPTSNIIMKNYMKFIENSLSELKLIPFYNLKDNPRANYTNLNSSTKASLNQCMICDKKNDNIKCNHTWTSKLNGGYTLGEIDDDFEDLNETNKSLYDQTDEFIVSCKQKVNKTKTNHESYSIKDFKQIKKCCNMAFGPSSCVEQFSSNFIIPLYAFNKEIFDIFDANYKDQNKLEYFEGEIFRKYYNSIKNQKDSMKNLFDKITNFKLLINKHNEDIRKDVDKSVSKLIFDKTRRNKIIQEKMNLKYGSFDL